jgi:uncharacterized protein YkwD
LKALQSLFLSVAAYAGIALIGTLTPLPHRDNHVAYAAGPCAIPGIEVDLDSEERAFLTLINAYRAEQGRAPLAVSFTLSRASAWKSRHLGENAYFAHDDTPIGRGWSTRVRDCGYSYNTAIGENIAAGYGTAAQVFEGWRNSPGHNSNMLGSNYTTIGIGRVVVSGSPYGTYWTTVFGGFDDGFIESSSAPATAVNVPDASASTIGTSATNSVATGGGGAPRLRLNFSGLCARLLGKGHPAYDRICRSR